MSVLDDLCKANGIIEEYLHQFMYYKSKQHLKFMYIFLVLFFILYDNVFFLKKGIQCLNACEVHITSSQ